MLSREGLASPPGYFKDPKPLLSGMGRLTQQTPTLPGSGGFYSTGDISSSSPFQMSMVDASTPNLNPVGKRGGVQSGVSGIRDLNNYTPIHKIKLDGYPKRLFTVENNVTRETIIVLAATQQISLYILKIKNDDEAKTPHEKFEFVKFHDVYIQPHDLEGFAISQNCSITLVPFKLTYALSTRSGKNVYVYDQGKSNEVPNVISLEELSVENPSATASSHIIQFAHDYPVTNLAIDSEKDYLACIQELGTIIVWDISTKVKLAVFKIPHQGVFISFHRSEPFQLMVIDTNGWARFFNVFRQCCYRSIHLVQPSVFAADWSISNSNIFAAGFAEFFTVIDTCKVLSSMNKCYEVPELLVNAIKFNPVDDKAFATLNRLTGTVQLWRDNFATHIWKHKNAYVNDIAWVHGYPVLMALGHQTLFFYESSIS